MFVASSYDVIVCGAGAAGCVLAARLASDPRVSVLLLEAGGSDETELVSDPTKWPLALGSDLDWDDRTEPNEALEGRIIPYNTGRVLGGGSSINVCTWSRGHQADWNFFAAEARDARWNYASVLEIYRRKVECWTGTPDPDFRGSDGLIHIRPAEDHRPFSEALLKGAAHLGLPTFANANGRMMEAESGCSFVDETIEGSRRRSVYRQYVHPLLERSNLKVVTQATVTRLLFEGRKATGVAFDYQGRSVRVSARCEVVLSLGAIRTPQLLMLSGVGPKTELERLGIPARQVLSGVGQNLHDHAAISLVFEGQPDALPHAPRSQTACFWKTDRSLDSPNAYCYVSNGAKLTPENLTSTSVPPAAWSLIMGVRLQGRGNVSLKSSSDPGLVRVDPNYLSDPADIGTVKTAYRFARELAHSKELSGFNLRESTPNGSDDALLERYIRRGLTTFWHPSGTAKMGSDDMAVVDGQLKVHGLDQLRIADASIMPRVTTGNTMAPCVVIGERAAELVANDLGL